jgi:NAD dependent epimerase/dehydratase family enzyme
VQYYIMQDTIRSFPSKARPMGDLPAQLDYVKVIQDTMRLVNALLTLEANVILITRTAPQRSSTDRIQPMFVGSTTASNVAALVDVVAYMAIEDGKRVIYTDHPQAITKSRIVLPSRVEEPVWERVFQIPTLKEA